MKVVIFRGGQGMRLRAGPRTLPERVRGFPDFTSDQGPGVSPA
jgi:hypothetical protein